MTNLHHSRRGGLTRYWGPRRSGRRWRGGESIVEHDVVAETADLAEMELVELVDAGPVQAGEGGAGGCVGGESGADEGEDLIDEALAEQVAEGYGAAFDQDIGGLMDLCEVSHERFEVQWGAMADGGKGEALDAEGLEFGGLGWIGVERCSGCGDGNRSGVRVLGE